MNRKFIVHLQQSEYAMPWSFSIRGKREQQCSIVFELLLQINLGYLLGIDIRVENEIDID